MRHHGGEYGDMGIAREYEAYAKEFEAYTGKPPTGDPVKDEAEIKAAEMRHHGGSYGDTAVAAYADAPAHGGPVLDEGESAELEEWQQYVDEYTKTVGHPPTGDREVDRQNYINAVSREVDAPGRSTETVITDPFVSPDADPQRKEIGYEGDASGIPMTELKPGQVGVSGAEVGSTGVRNEGIEEVEVPEGRYLAAGLRRDSGWTVEGVEGEIVKHHTNLAAEGHDPNAGVGSIGRRTSCSRNTYRT